MKKLISLMLISFIVIAISTTAFATDILNPENGNNVTTITGNEYNSAQSNNAAGNNTSLPQTGIEDSGLGILLIICAISAVFAYKKISDYKNI